MALIVSNVQALGDFGITALAEALRFDTVVESLDISSTNFGANGAIALSTMLSDAAPPSNRVPNQSSQALQPATGMSRTEHVKSLVDATYQDRCITSTQQLIEKQMWALVASMRPAIARLGSWLHVPPLG